MTAFTTRREFIDRLATRGFCIPTQMSPLGTGTAAGSTLAGGFLNVQLVFDNFASTIPTTLVGLKNAPLTANPMSAAMAWSMLSNGGGWTMAYAYKIGTLNLAATGDQFTHDAATFPILRTRMGEASKPLPLIPAIYVTTATTVTAPIVTLKNGAASTGYVDQDGNTVVGTRTLTFPNAATAVQTGLMPLLELTDYAIRDIQQINVGTAASAGAATVFGIELLLPTPNLIGNVLGGMIDTGTDTFFPLDLRPGVATSGTATALLCFVQMRANSALSSSSDSAIWFGCENV